MAPVQLQTAPDLPAEAEVARRYGAEVVTSDFFRWFSPDRHGKFDGSATKRFSTGQSNLLFLDGHVVTADRGSLPANRDQWIGTSAQKRNPDPLLFSTNQLR